MPIPIILGGIAVASAVAGIKKGIDANNKNNDAKGIVKDAQERFEDAQERLEKERIRLNNELKEFAKFKLFSSYHGLRGNSYLMHTLFTSSNNPY